MPLKAPPSFGLVKRDEKETRLRAFIDERLANAPAAPQAQALEQTTILVIARSSDSPVSKAVLAMGAEATGRNVCVRAIFTTLGTSDTARIAEACQLSECGLQIRWARDIRLMEAHEQLVLGPRSSWIGDCMRREPLKHDAFEVFAPDCEETAQRARLFFERLWKASEPIIDRPYLARSVMPEPVMETPSCDPPPASDPGVPAPPRTTVQ